jgi:hypothetical protein
MILNRVQMIAAYSQEGLIAEIARIYRLHFGQQCSLLGWESYSLMGLQVAALCIGNANLGILCFALSYNYKQFRSGAPDLFLVRVRRRKVNQLSDESWEAMNLDQALGLGWKSAPSSRSTRREEDESWALRSPTRATRSSNGNDEERNSDVFSQMRSPSTSEPAVAMESSSKRRRVHSSKESRPRLSLENVNAITVNLTKDYEDENLPIVSGRTDAVHARKMESTERDSMQHLRFMLSQRSPLTRSALPSPTVSPSKRLGNVADAEDATLSMSPIRKKLTLQSQIALDEPGLSLAQFYGPDVNMYELDFESMCIEVKGPTDHLAYKQVLWLQLLSLMTSCFKAYVCHVKE